MRVSISIHYDRISRILKIGTCINYENLSMQYTETIESFHWKNVDIFNIGSKQRLWVHVRTAHRLTETVLTNTHNQCFRSKIRKIRGASKKFVNLVNKIKSTYAISLKLLYVCDQFYVNKHRKFKTNRLINVVVMTIFSMGVSIPRSTPRR